MQLKVVSKKVVLLVALSGFMLLTAFLAYLNQRSVLPETETQTQVLFDQPVSVVLPIQEEEHVGLPARLLIPILDVSTEVIPVGVTVEGEMEVPKGPDEVAWFQFGPRPGEVGSAVIAGHYGWKNDIPAVFDNLHKLREGDKILVVDQEGVVTTFVVREIRVYDKADSAFDVFRSSDGKVHLNLITCTGDWNTEEKTRPERLVIFSDLE